MKQEYVAKTKQDRVYLSGLLKDRRDRIPNEFFDDFVRRFRQEVPIALFLDYVNNSYFSEETVKWLVRQGIIEPKKEVKQVTFRRQRAFSGKDITINPDEYRIEFYRPSVPNTVHVKFYHNIFSSNWDSDNVSYFAVELNPEVLDKLNQYQIKIKE